MIPKGIKNSAGKNAKGLLKSSKKLGDFLKGMAKQFNSDESKREASLSPQNYREKPLTDERKFESGMIFF